MTTKEREQLERLIAQLEDPAEVRKAYVIPNGCSREFTRGYVDGAKMQAGAIAMALRGLVVAPAEESVVVAEELGHMSDEQYEFVKKTVSRVDPARIKRRGIR